MVGTVRPTTHVFFPTSRTRFADERGISPLRLQMGWNCCALSCRQTLLFGQGLEEQTPSGACRLANHFCCATTRILGELRSQACAHFCHLRCIGSHCRFASRPLWGLSCLRELLPRFSAHAKHGMPCGDGAFALSETFGQSLFGESGTAFCILLVRFC